MAEKPNSISDIDNFWNLNELLPKKRHVTPSPRQPNTETVELTIGGSPEADIAAPIPPKSTTGASDRYRAKTLDPYLIYEPESRLMKRVEISKWDSRFNFYEGFRQDAKRLFNRTGSPCDHASFFSYIPQYSQLKYSQLKWYLWWRTNIYNGVYLRCDFCYILLFIYEIINSPELIPPEKGVQLLCGVWLGYREQHRRLDSYMCDWLCDYCLIHRIPCPIDMLEPLLGVIVENASFKEFYMDNPGYDNAGANILFYSSMYDWHKSRYVTEENRALFSAHIHGAFDSAYKALITDGGEFAKELRIERAAFEGALCAYDIKRTIAVEYISYTRSPKLRFVITDIIKYSENRIRMAIGVRSRLKVEYLTDSLRDCVDRYFDRNLPAPRKVRERAAVADTMPKGYEKLYEPISTALSEENAMKIEELSWSTAEALTAVWEDPSPVENIAETQETSAPPPAVPSDTADGENEFEIFVNSIDEVSARALALISSGDPDGVAKAAADVNMLADALADRINEAAFDIIGDSVIEYAGDGYRLIPDYEGDIKKWLK